MIQGSKLHLRGLPCGEEGLVNEVGEERGGFRDLRMQVRRLRQGGTWKAETGECEALLVLLGGSVSVKASCGAWDRVGERHNVFAGMPSALYLPRETSFQLRALAERTEFALAEAPAKECLKPKLVSPGEVAVELRGGGNATRQINAILPPGSPCERLVCVEVYTPSGNWSSYPPHKHDVHRVGSRGELLEADLEEIYFYKISAPEGFALQRVYTDDGRLDEVLVASDNDVVLVPEGYHPVVAAPGYHCYYLNFLAGSAQSLAAADDPRYSWVREKWGRRDPRVPLVSLSSPEEKGG